MHEKWLVALDEVNIVTVASQQAADRLVTGTAQHRRAGNLVTVEVEYGQHRAIASSVEKLDSFPRAFERCGFRFTVADHRDRDELGVIEYCAERMGQHVTELATFVNRTRCRRTDMTGRTAGRRELAEQPCHTSDVQAHRRIHLGIRSFEIYVCQNCRTAVPWPCEINNVEIIACNDAIEVRVDKVLPRRRSPMAEQPRLDVLVAQWLAKQRIAKQKDLPDGEIVSRAPIGVDREQLVVIHGFGDHVF